MNGRTADIAMNASACRPASGTPRPKSLPVVRPEYAPRTEGSASTMMPPTTVITPTTPSSQRFGRSRSRHALPWSTMSTIRATRMIGIRTASWNRAQVASTANRKEIQSQREPGRASAVTSAASDAAASGSARFSMIIWPALVIHDPARISTAGTSATSGVVYRRASSHVGNTTAQIMNALMIFAIAYALRQRVRQQPGRRDRVDVERGAHRRSTRRCRSGRCRPRTSARSPSTGTRRARPAAAAGGCRG